MRVDGRDSYTPAVMPFHILINGEAAYKQKLGN
jgi:hypothetical protein